MFCDKSVDWKHKSTIDSHFNGIKHEAKQQVSHQQTLQTTLRAADSKKIVIEDLIDAFVGADIPLQKVDKLLPFFKKHLKEGGAIPQAPTLRQIYLPNVFERSFSFYNTILDTNQQNLSQDSLKILAMMHFNSN